MEDKASVKDIRERAFVFAVRIIKFCKYLEGKRDVSSSLINQLLRSGTSIGANLEEVQGAQSKADFISKNSIALKESRETYYWLKLIAETNNFDENIGKGLNGLITESEELKKIIGAMIDTTETNT